jgi:hypothetical protein
MLVRPFHLGFSLLLWTACVDSEPIAAGGSGATGGEGSGGTPDPVGGAPVGGSAQGGAPIGGAPVACVGGITENVYANTDELNPLVQCLDGAVLPAPGEDGTFAVTVFGPFPETFTLGGFSFLATENADTLQITDPWTASVTVVPEGQDPLQIDVSASAQPFALVRGAEVSTEEQTVVALTIELAEPLVVGACDSVVVALRNSEGPPATGINQCKMVPSTHPETNLWWNLDGTMSTMQSFGAQFDYDWAMTLVPL